MGDINWEGHFDKISERNSDLEKSWGDNLSPSRENILNKARAGTYENNAANRKKGIAGMKYGGMKVKEEKKISLKDVLVSKEGKKIIEGIEGLDPKNADHQDLFKDYQKQLKDKFGYDYKSSSWDKKGEKGLKVSIAYGDAKFHNRSMAIQIAGKMTKPENYSVLQLKDGGYLRATNRRASQFEKQGDGKVIGSFMPNQEFREK